MSRSGKLLVLGFVAVLASGVVLHRIATRDEANAGTPGKPEVTTGTVTSAKPASARVASDEDAPEPPVVPLAEKPGPPVVRPTERPAIAANIPTPSADEQIEYSQDGKAIPVATLAVLRKAAAATEEQLKECIAKAGGKSVTGKALVTFVVARKKAKDGSFTVETESSAFEDEGTTLTDPQLVECLHKTAFAMKFPSSKSPVAVWSRRRIVIENGQVAENWVIEFGRIF